MPTNLEVAYSYNQLNKYVLNHNIYEILNVNFELRQFYPSIHQFVVKTITNCGQKQFFNKVKLKLVLVDFKSSGCVLSKQELFARLKEAVFQSHFDIDLLFINLKICAGLSPNLPQSFLKKLTRPVEVSLAVGLGEIQPHYCLPKPI